MGQPKEWKTKGDSRKRWVCCEGYEKRRVEGPLTEMTEITNSSFLIESLVD